MRIPIILGVGFCLGEVLCDSPINSLLFYSFRLEMQFDKFGPSADLMALQNDF